MLLNDLPTAWVWLMTFDSWQLKASYLETPIKLRHLLRIVSFCRLDAFLKSISLPLKVFADFDKSVHSGFKRPNEWPWVKRLRV